MPPDVVCNTSPLQYLHSLRLLDLLPRFYGTVAVPEAVEQELFRGLAMGLDLPKVKTLGWAAIVKVTMMHPSIAHLGAGEASVITWAIQNKTSLVLMDDRQAREAAKNHQLKVSGTLGVLIRAKQEAIIQEIAPLLASLRQAGFRLTPAMELRVLSLVGETSKDEQD